MKAHTRFCPNRDDRSRPTGLDEVHRYWVNLLGEQAAEHQLAISQLTDAVRSLGESCQALAMSVAALLGEEAGMPVSANEPDTTEPPAPGTGYLDDDP